MPSIKFLDGSTKNFPDNVTGIEIAKSISPSLSKDAIAIVIDGIQKDLNFVINNNCEIEIITKDSIKGLEIIRHDTAHVMAEAVKELFPNVQVTIGPPIENGFYYDFAKKEPFNLEDLIKIEKKMHEIIKKNEKFEREIWSRKKAENFFKEQGEKYKLEILNDISKKDEI